MICTQNTLRSRWALHAYLQVLALCLVISTKIASSDAEDRITSIYLQPPILGAGTGGISGLGLKLEAYLWGSIVTSASHKLNLSPAAGARISAARIGYTFQLNEQSTESKKGWHYILTGLTGVRHFDYWEEQDGARSEVTDQGLALDLGIEMIRWFDHGLGFSISVCIANTLLLGDRSVAEGTFDPVQLDTREGDLQVWLGLTY